MHYTLNVKRYVASCHPTVGLHVRDMQSPYLT